ncbi:protein translocase subunit SecF [Gulosibacter molinativorax]|uniref:Protein-export membrane protein SecF n=1 Tax=Gulosibacter molinativorax TaxID=256821 RepID=A0ABT7C794_9MICO|nr:protein translocase subunit SecF [Gulosibacter molinativorax]MDJ1371045.1 protein translocase subunit SecF [Gulosibacter molinativorax]QUY61405.1 Protein-export membrane protein SecF [Gulosibacter molinativorax]
MKKFGQLGNDLYTGERSFGFVKNRKIWFGIAALLIVASVLVPVLRGGFNFGIEFTGGSEFQISNPASTEQPIATEAVAAYSDAAPRVQQLGDGSIRVQTDALSDADNTALRADLAEAYGTSVEEVTVSTIGPSWGADITRQMLIGLGVFLVLASAFMAFYFRTWKMALAAILTLFHDLILTAGIYALTGVEVTPAAVIGFLTILGYSLYDTVVVFDKIRENTADYSEKSSRTFGEQVNLAINQTLVRSINTSVVALLPVAAILFIGAFVMGAGTLRDISLALFIGIIVGALSTVFIAGPLYAQLRTTEPGIKDIDREILEAREKAAERDSAATAAAV